MKKPYIRLLVLLIIFSLSVGVFLFQSRMRKAGPIPSSPSTPSLTSPLLEPKRSVRLFFLSPGEDSLQEEFREIRSAGTVDEEAKRVLSELIKGPTSSLLSPLPVGTQLRQLYIDGQGIAFADFGPELRDRHPGGSSAEMWTIYAIVNTLGYNFEQIKRVKILIDSAEVETLAGHIDLRKPLKPRMEFDGAFN